MTTIRLASLAFSTAFGLLMVAATVVETYGIGLVAAILAAVAVLAGVRYRVAATVAVLLTVVTIVLADAPPVIAAVSGLCAAAYLVVRFAAGPPAGVVTVTMPTVLGAVGFTLAGVVATFLPLQLPWLPLLAPLAVFAAYVLAARPFMRR